ncbi:C-type lectin domain family 12 member A-like [Gambusia affinis]|uniref:C-type lectin domain family 12 member A-like n=1 Tax=Gambusia affinis TaxID=33528 RepID=UPI001CDC27D4|nr:C-type lectin domain family 12 member A-like [Gambusia affinis]
MKINILGTKVHVVLVFLGTLCVLLLFGCIGVISWGGWKMNQQDAALAHLSNLKNLNETLQEETEKLSQKVENLNEKSQNETKKLSSQLENLNEKLQEETEKLNQTIQLIQKFKAFLFNEQCNYKECLPCQTGWIYFSDSCYLFSNVERTWDGSRWFCQNKSADLVVINNQQEQEFIYGNINTNKLYWLGLRNYGRYVNSVLEMD